MFTRQFYTKVILFMVLFVVLIYSKANAENKKLQLSVGLDSRSVSTHFYQYNYNYAYNHDTWEDFSLTGLKAEMSYNIIKKRMAFIDIGGGIGLFKGDYDYYIGVVQGSGDTNAFEITVFTNGGYNITPKVSLFGRVGLSFLIINADEASPSISPYNESFTEYFSELYIAPGIRYDISEKIAASLLYRDSITEIDYSADYRDDPSLESLSNTGIILNLDFRF